LAEVAAVAWSRWRGRRGAWPAGLDRSPRGPGSAPRGPALPAGRERSV